MDFFRRISFGIKGYREFVQSAYLAKKEKFNEADTNVSLKDEFVMITGANSGLGKQAAIDIAKKGATVYIVCRNKERGEAALQEIKEKSENTNVELLLCDLSSPKETLKFARDFTKAAKPLTILCANAGVLLNEHQLVDDKKYEATFATNTLSVHIFVRELADKLKQAENPKVLITTSGGGLTRKLDPEGHDFEQKNKFDGVIAYSQTKRQEIEMAEVYAKEYPKIFFATWHPGWADTPGVEKSLPGFYKQFKNKLRTVEEGSDTLFWLTCLKDPLQRFNNGALFFDREEVSKHLWLGNTEATSEMVSKFIGKLDKFYEEEKQSLNL